MAERGLTADDAALLLHRSARRRADGSRGVRARHAWRRLVRACAAGDPAAQDTARAAAAGLRERDALDLAAAAPEEPTDRAAYLVLIGQFAQRRALDPDGSLLALAYRAAPPRIRARLRTAMAAEGDGEVIRVVVTGDRRDRVAEMSYDELDYLGHHLAERQDWAELRRLVRDLPLAKGAAAARLLPVTERTDGVVGLLAGASAPSPEQLRALVDRLPRDAPITYDVSGDHQGASFSPDTSELALRYAVRKRGLPRELRVETLRIGTGDITRRFAGSTPTAAETETSILHLGDEILVKLRAGDELCRITRILPVYETVGAATAMSDLRRTSRGAVVLCPGGPAFVDPGALGLRHEPTALSAPPGTDRGRRWISVCHTLATLPAARLIAFSDLRNVYVTTEDGQLLHAMPLYRRVGGDSLFSPVLSFLSRNSLALHQNASRVSGQSTEIWEFGPDGDPRRTEHRLGVPRKRWPDDTWRVPVLDDAFAARVYASGTSRLDIDLPWLRYPQSATAGVVRQRLLTLTPGQDMFVVSRTGADDGFEVHSPHLPTARTLLERPLLHGRPQDVRHVQDLRSRIGDPAVRDALDLLATCLIDRSGGDIALGRTDDVPAGGPTDLALGGGRRDPEDRHRQRHITHQGEA
ncbi:hypothetical protein ALMP_76290 [Streptomyces sp. A012304]|nr:hypothetical protein ALMP_76290 [Streptomyces sp. A012304]